ncbi:MAG TPA: ribonuclease H-like domain-containing protein [Polyangiaceae bacterium]|nr:ribonuclease H-like domain-containing protein [Polyangiaceae bacterium]
MNLKRRLERLAGGAATSAATGASDAPTPSTPPPASGVFAVRDTPAADATKQRALDELRRQMQELLGRSERANARATPRRPPPARGIGTLPFSALQTPHGVLWQRLERLEPSRRVGRVALDAARSADPRVLADLALDPALAASLSESWLFVDTETTGLGGAGTLVFLVGLATIEPSGAVLVEQLLLVDPSEERALLEHLRERMQGASAFVSFNGKAFDRPMLDTRAVLNRMKPLPVRPHFDLLHVGRRLHRQRLGSCTLGRVEIEVLEFDRGDDIDGSEVAAIYSHFLRSADATGVSAVVAHNFTDVVSMVALVGLYGQRTPELVAEDLAGLARTLKRAGATHHAERVADIACERGGGVEAYRVRAELAKSRGDCSSAVRDFERLCREADDPSGRLELAKLYEHKLRQPARALHWLELGTAEDPQARTRRRERLERKLRRGPAL